MHFLEKMLEKLESDIYFSLTAGKAGKRPIFSCDEQLYKTVCLSICLSVCLFVCCPSVGYTIVKSDSLPYLPQRKLTLVSTGKAFLKLFFNFEFQLELILIYGFLD